MVEPGLVRPLSEMLAEGIINTVQAGQYDRGTVIFFHATGALMLIVGKSMNDYERDTGGLPVPASTGLALGVCGAAGAAFMPNSGFWLLIPLGLYIWKRARDGSAADAAARRPMVLGDAAKHD